MGGLLRGAKGMLAPLKNYGVGGGWPYPSSYAYGKQKYLVRNVNQYPTIIKSEGIRRNRVILPGVF